MSGTPKVVRDGLGESRGGLERVGDLRGGLGRVEGPSGKSGMGWGDPRVGSETGWRTLEKVRDGLEESRGGLEGWETFGEV